VPITASAVSLNLTDPIGSAALAEWHLGFKQGMAADGFVSLSRADAGFNLIFLQTGLETFKPDSLRDRHADGLLVVFQSASFENSSRSVALGRPASRPIGASRPGS
jgi:hypothetical protein